MRVWYINPNGTPVVWSSAVVNGVAVTEVHRIEPSAPGAPLRRSLWRAVGDAATGAAVTAAQSEQSADPVPTETTSAAPPPAATSGLAFGILAAATAGVKADGTTDDTAALQAAVDAADAAGVELVLPQGSIYLTGTVRSQNADGRIRGAAPGQTGLLFESGSTYHGLVVGPSLTYTGGGQGTGLDRPAGYVRDLSISSVGGRVDGSVAAGLMLAGAPVDVSRVHVSGFGVGFDLTGNCYGAMFTHCFTNFGEVNVGMRLRTGNLSGQDLVFIDCWLRGRYAGVHMDPWSAGYTFLGGQMGAGYGLTADQPAWGAVTAGRDLELMLTGTRSPGTPSDQGNVRNVVLKGVNYEGLHRVHALRTYEPQTGWAVEGCHFIPSMNAADQSDAPLAVWKGTAAWDSAVSFRDNVIGGGTSNRWKGSNGKIIDVDTYQDAWPRLSEEGTYGFWSLVGGSELRAHQVGLMESSGVLHRQGGVLVGVGTPTVAAPVSSLYRRTDGAAGTALYVKETGTDGTGWVASKGAANPLVASGGAAGTGAAGAQTGATPPPVTVTGNATRGYVQWGTGTGPTVGEMVSVTYPAGAWSAAPYVTITPANAETAALDLYLVTRTATGFKVNARNAPAGGLGQYALAFYFHAIG